MSGYPLRHIIATLASGTACPVQELALVDLIGCITTRVTLEYRVRTRKPSVAVPGSVLYHQLLWDPGQNFLTLNKVFAWKYSPGTHSRVLEL